MHHLLLTNEYPPAPCGETGAYAVALTQALAAAGETVHVVTSRWRGAENAREQRPGGRVVIHRFPFVDWNRWPEPVPHPDLPTEARSILLDGPSPAPVFAWLACREAERILAEETVDVVEGIDFQAPLYYFQIRRALGLNPQLPAPPCVVHLTGPTEHRARKAGEESFAPAHLVNKRHEDHGIPCADLLLCQNETVAEEARNRYDLDADILALLPTVPPEEGWPAATALPFYERVAAGGAGRSLRLPRSRRGAETPSAVSPDSHGGGIAVVVTCFNLDAI